MIPKIKFTEMTLEENINIIKWAYYEKNEALSIHDYTICLLYTSPSPRD